MTEQEALRMAQENLFDVLEQDEFASLYTFDRDSAQYAKVLGGKRPMAIKRCYIGCGQNYFGNGASWEEAVENLLVVRKVAVDRESATTYGVPTIAQFLRQDAVRQ